MSAASAAAPERVRVFARQRPLGRGEEDVASVIADPSSGEVAVNVAAVDAVERVLAGGSVEPTVAPGDAQNNTKRFRFDGAFDSASSQDDVFQAVGLPVLKDVMRGFHGCVMAYGQTGSGKTHSLLNTGGPESAGLLPRLIATLFVRIGADASHRHQVRVSAVQVYNEQVSDLLHPDHAGGSGQGLNVQSNGTVQGATWLPCRDPQTAMKAFAQARTSLVYAETKMNKASSRSHAAFQLEVARYAATDDAGCDKATLGMLTVVDLAGSERVKRSGVVGQQMKEAININGSLLALGNVVQALAVQKKHVPFRDSKLTRLLEPALSGNCRTSLLVCVSPTLESAQETCHALEFASRAMRVEVCAKVNEVDVTSLCSELSQLATVPLAERVDHELQQKSQHISTLEERLTQSAEAARKWEERSSMEAQRAIELQESFKKDTAALERTHKDALEQTAVALKRLQAESAEEKELHKRRESELSAEVVSARQELQAKKTALEAALAAKQAEVDASCSDIARMKAVVERANEEQGKRLKDLKTSHERSVADLEAKHQQREAWLQSHVELLRKEMEGSHTNSATLVQAKMAEIEGLRETIRSMRATSEADYAKQEATMSEFREEQRRHVDELNSVHRAEVAGLEEAIRRLKDADEASRAELTSARALADAAEGELHHARQSSAEALRAATCQADELQRKLQSAEERTDVARREVEALHENVQAAQMSLAEAQQRLQWTTAAREEDHQHAQAQHERAESFLQELRAQLTAAGSETLESAARCRAAEVALVDERAALKLAHATESAATKAAHAEEVGLLLATHNGKCADLQSAHARELEALTARHEATTSEIRWRLTETEEAFKVLQRRFDGRESRPDDVAAMARHRKTIRELSAERKALGLELQHQLQTDKVFGGGEKKRVQAPLRNVLVGKKLGAPSNAVDRREVLLNQMSNQSNRSYMEPIC